MQSRNYIPDTPAGWRDFTSGCSVQLLPSLKKNTFIEKKLITVNYEVDSDNNDDEFFTNSEDPQPDLQERENRSVTNCAVCGVTVSLRPVAI